MLPPAAFAVAGLAALAVTSFALYDKHGRHPFGDLRTLWWWALIAAADVFVAMLGLGAGILKGGPEALRRIGVIGWLAIGILVPLGLRSPVRTVRLAGEEQGVGLTKFYDTFRIHCDRAVDDGISRLRRSDREKLIDRALAHEWSPERLDSACRAQLAELRSRTPAEIEEIEAGLASALSFPDERQRFDGLFKVIYDQGLRSVLREVRKGPPNGG